MEYETPAQAIAISKEMKQHIPRVGAERVGVQTITIHQQRQELDSRFAIFHKIPDITQITNSKRSPPIRFTFPVRTFVRKSQRDLLRIPILSEQIKWLNSLPQILRSHFPQVEKSYVDENKLVYYDMPFYEGYRTITKLLFESKINAEHCLNFMRKILDFVFKYLYSITTGQVPNDYIKNLHLTRVKDRLTETIQRETSFKEIIDSQNIRIANTSFPNILSIISNIEKKPNTLTDLIPSKLVMIHGDLHFGNILVKYNEQTNELMDFILIDPGGFKNGGDIFYDMGKLWHSFHGLYDFLLMNEFNLNYQEEGEPCFDLRITKKEVLKEYEKINSQFTDLLLNYKQIKEEKNWELRTLFSEACHFCSMIPFHITNISKARAMYATGVRLLNECYNKLCSKL
jgi:hypothetical protein